MTAIDKQAFDCFDQEQGDSVRAPGKSVITANRIVAVVLGAAVASACASAQGPTGSALLAQQQYIEAEAEYRRQMRANPEQAGARDGLGASLAGQGKFREACPLLGPSSQPLGSGQCWLDAFESAASDNRSSLVQLYYKQANLKGVESPIAVKILGIVADVARNLQDWELLIEVYPRMLSFNPEDASLHYLYARALEARKYYDRAYREYEMASDLDPENAEVVRYMRRLQAQMKKAGTGSAARIEDLDQASVNRLQAGGDGGVTIQEWGKGSVEAVMNIESMGEDSDELAPDLRYPVEILKAHWPSQTFELVVTSRISNQVAGIVCPALGNPGQVTVTVGPKGTVTALSVQGLSGSQKDCLSRHIRRWVFDELSGGFLKFSFEWPAPDEGEPGLSR